MTTIAWTPTLLPFVKDPDDVDDYPFDFTDWLAGDTINVAGTSALAEGCTAAIADVTGNVVTLRISGGTDGTTGKGTIRIATAGGRQADRSIRFKFQQL